MEATTQQAEQLNKLYWSFYWSGDLQAATSVVQLMRSVGVDANGHSAEQRRIAMCRTLIRRRRRVK